MFTNRFMKNRSEPGSSERPIHPLGSYCRSKASLATLDRRRKSFASMALTGALENKSHRLTYSSYTRSHSLLPSRYPSKISGLHGNGYALPPYHHQPSQLKDQNALESFTPVKFSSHKIHRSPCQKLELLGHTEEKIRELILSKASRTPLRYFDFDIEPSRYNQARSNYISKETSSDRGRSTYEEHQVRLQL